MVDDSCPTESASSSSAVKKTKKKSNKQQPDAMKDESFHDGSDVSETRTSVKEPSDSKIDSDCPNTKGVTENGPKSPSIDQVKSSPSKKLSCTQMIQSNGWFNAGDQPMTVQIKVDIAALLIFICAAVTRMWRLDKPQGIVFDELHYGKSVSLYMKQTFFFDAHPPLGKQLVALAGYIANFDGNAQFNGIGGEYPSHMPIRALRLVPALFGSLLAPTTYYLIIELGLTHRTAILAGILVILENSFLTQSRFILMESMLIWFSAFGILCLLKFRHEVKRPFGFMWWMWLILCSVSLTCAICVKYVGIFSAILAVSVLTWDYWQMIANTSLNARQLLIHLFARLSVVIVLPVCVYLTIFYIHLSILTKAGPHDNIMTSAFQASLEGGLASITKGQPLHIAHGSQITLRHTHGRACWLHSHLQVYPVRYPDDRGSSHQQQVTCYSFKDVNNWWIVKLPDVNDLVVSEPIQKIKHGDVVQLVHGMTSRALNSHDVAAPMSPQHQEVSCYIDYNISFPEQNLWRVDIINRETEGDVWHTIHSHVRLIHVNSGQALKFSGKQLPDWGFHQHEVVTDRVINQDDTIWNVEEHRYTKNADQKEREREMGMAEFVPLQPTQLSFLEKLWELQYKMLFTSNENVEDHMYSSEALDWPFLTRGIAYWISPESNAQIHLLGNIVTWYTATISIIAYSCLFVIYLLRRRRGFFDLPQGAWDKFCSIGQIGLAGYLLHFVPYFCVDRNLFLHHYLPAYFYSMLLLPAVIEHIDLLVSYTGRFLLRVIFYTVVVLWMIAAVYAFVQLSVFSYGISPMSADQIRALRWKETWDFIIHKL